MKNVQWRLTLVIFTFLLSLYLCLPNLFDKAYLPSNKINLGLDIRGGLSLLLEADLATHKKEQMIFIRQSILHGLKKKLNSTINDRIIALDAEGISNDVTSIMNGLMDKRFFSVYEENGRTLCKVTEQYLLSSQNSMIDRIIDVIRYRIDATGLQEISIQKHGADSVLVQIPGASDRSEIKRILSQTGSLKIHLVDMNITNKDIQNNHLPFDVKLLPMMVDVEEQQDIKVPIIIQPVMSGDMIADAYPSTHMGRHVVNFKLTDAGTKKFAEITKNNVRRTIAMVLDNKVITAPTINEPILTGSGQISGKFTFESAKQIAILLRSGSLPVPVKIVQETLIGPTLGKDAVSSGANCVVIGCAAVIVIMVIVYKTLGLIASLGLVCNLVLMLAVLSLVEATLTLPGIAGMALTLGMAVDANVLIYERMKEEARQQKSLRQIIKHGYEMALRTIMDSNITTVIVAFLLYAFGSSAIKGFAITLVIGIASSMVTAVIFTKIFIEAWYEIFNPKKLRL